MAELLSENAEALCKNYDNQTDRINSLIKQFTELTETINKNRRDRYYWKSQFSTLLISIWAGQVKYKELDKKEAQIRQAVSETTKMIDLIQQELKDLRAKRTECVSKQCDNFRAKYANYTGNIVHARKEYVSLTVKTSLYNWSKNVVVRLPRKVREPGDPKNSEILGTNESAENLLRDTERYRQEYSKEECVFSALKKKLENLETWYNLSCLNTEDTEDILKINTVLGDIKMVNNNELQNIMLAQSTLEKLEGEIKQKQKEINDFQK